LWYSFGHLGEEPWAWTSDDRRLSKTMTTYWANFARSGDPNGPSVPTWPVFSKKGGQTLYLGTPIVVGAAPDANSLAVFDAVYARVRGDAKTQADSAVGQVGK
jgi:para-nitrobenzyl esterase